MVLDPKEWENTQRRKKETFSILNNATFSPLHNLKLQGIRGRTNEIYCDIWGLHENSFIKKYLTLQIQLILLKLYPVVSSFRNIVRTRKLKHSIISPSILSN